MKANELRVGNLFQDKDGNVLTCCGVTQESHENKGLVWYDNELGFYLHLDECFPVKLSEEWMVKFGFERKKDNEKYWEYIYHGEQITAVCIENGYAFIGQKGNRVKIQCYIDYVHKLQNLFQELTGEELTCKNQ